MPLTYLEHFLIQTTDFATTCEWYERVLGLARGYTPDFRFPVQWMYLGDRDVLHITQGGAKVSENRLRYNGQESQDDFGSGVVDHIAFRCKGLPEMIDPLPAVPHRSERREDRAQLRERRSDRERHRARADGIRSAGMTAVIPGAAGVDPAARALPCVAYWIGRARLCAPAGRMR
jgi:catechol 2,3-dioxygenase-like lactoylglutathione lyase family enzyme